MYTGTVIKELMEMVARAEGRAQNRGIAAKLESDDQTRASRFVYHATDSQPIMIGVA